KSDSLRRIGRTAAPLTIVAAIVVSLGGMPAYAAVSASPGRIFVVALPVVEARRLAIDAVAAEGLGGFPDSRDPTTFVREISTGAPVGVGAIRSPLHGAPGNLGLTLVRAGVGVFTALGGPETIRSSL